MSKGKAFARIGTFLDTLLTKRIQLHTAQLSDNIGMLTNGSYGNILC